MKRHSGIYKINKGADSDAEETKRKLCVRACFALIFFLALSACVAVVVYLVVGNAAEGNRAPIPDGPFNFRVELHLRNNWIEGLEASSSSIFKEVSRNFISGVNTTFTDSSPFGNFYQRAEIFSFTLGDTHNIRASFLCFFSGSPPGVTGQAAFTDRFTTELLGGFESGNFPGFALRQGEPITVVSYATTTTAA